MTFQSNSTTRYDLRRHDLVFLKKDSELSHVTMTDEIREWIQQGFPLVFTRQQNLSSKSFCLAFSLPLHPQSSQKRKISGEFPLETFQEVRPPLELKDCLSRLSGAEADVLQPLEQEFAEDLGVTLRVFGSLAWEALSSKKYRTPSSDFDLLCDLPDTADIDRVLNLLKKADDKLQGKLDGELRLSHGYAVSWRELFRQIQKPHQKILIKGTQTVELMSCGDFLKPLILERLCQEATDSLHAELSLELKPGLVCPLDNGSHTDMDFELMEKSIYALKPFFKAIAQLGFIEAPFEELKFAGIKAEQTMLLATQGVNTHRGAIFNLGLLVAATASLSKSIYKPSAQEICNRIRETWGSAILKENSTFQKKWESHGEYVRRTHTTGGARAEASLGFQSILGRSLPVYRETLQKTSSHRLSAIQALYTLIAFLEDTNLLWRAGLDGLEFAQKCASDFLNSGGVHAEHWQETAQRLSEQFKARKLSPGGSADLLAATLFLNRYP